LSTADSNRITVTYDSAGKALKLGLHPVSSRYQQALPFDLNVADLVGLLPNGAAKTALSALTDLVSVESSGQVAVTASADLTLDVGINLDSTDTANYLKPFFYDTTSATLTAGIQGTGLSFRAAVGSLGLFIEGGTASL